MIGRIIRGVMLVLMAANGLWFLRNIAWIASPETAIAHNPDIPDFAAPGLVIGKMVVLLMVGLDYLLAVANILLKRYEFAKFAMFGTTLLVVTFFIEAMLWSSRYPAIWEEFAIWTLAGLVHVGTAVWYLRNGEGLLEDEELETATVQRVEEEEEVPELEMTKWKDEPKF
jgi:hypothetical protein